MNIVTVNIPICVSIAFLAFSILSGLMTRWSYMAWSDENDYDNGKMTVVWGVLTILCVMIVILYSE